MTAPANIRARDIGETANFLGGARLIVPNARFACANLVVFYGNAGRDRPPLDPSVAGADMQHRQGPA